MKIEGYPDIIDGVPIYNGADCCFLHHTYQNFAREVQNAMRPHTHKKNKKNKKDKNNTRRCAGDTARIASLEQKDKCASKQ